MLVKVVGFLIGFAVVVAAEFALLAALNMTPRGAGWIGVPIMAGIALAGAAPGLVARFSTSGSALWQQSSHVRLVAVLCALWLAGVPAYWWLFEPYDYRMGSDDWALMGKTMLFPVVVLVVAFVAYIKVVVPRPLDRPSKASAEVTAVAPSEVEVVSAPVTSPSPARSPTTTDSATLAVLATVIERRQATIQTYMDLARAMGGTVDLGGGFFNSYYIVDVCGACGRVDSFDGLRKWFLDNVIPHVPSAQSTAGSA